MVYSNNPTRRGACDRRMVTFAHTAPTAAGDQRGTSRTRCWPCRSPPCRGTRACAPVRQFNDLGAAGAAAHPGAGGAGCRSPPGAEPGRPGPVAARTSPAAKRGPPLLRPQPCTGTQAPTQSLTGDSGAGVTRPVALITGPTSGLGEGAGARRFARDGHDLVLVARDVERLGALADELRARHGVGVRCCPADLAGRRRPSTGGRVAVGRVQVLVNNAGLAPPEESSDRRTRLCCNANSTSTSPP